jgi:hypothetical protein
MHSATLSMAVPSGEWTLQAFLGYVNEHLAQYTSLNSDTSDEIFRYLQELLHSLRIKFFHEATTQALDRLQALRKPDSGIIPNRLRVVLKTERTKADFRHELVRRCNGMVIVIEETTAPSSTSSPSTNTPTSTGTSSSTDTSTNASSTDTLASGTAVHRLRCKVLAMPVREVNPGPSRLDGVESSVRKREYDIYPVRDGSILHLYYDEGHCHEVAGVLQRGKWYYGSRNAFCVEENLWRGYSYRDVLHQLRERIPLDMSALDPTCTYTLGIYHPAFHPFNQPAVWSGERRLDEPGWLYDLWLIHTARRDATSIWPLPAIGLNRHEPITDEVSLNSIREWNRISYEVLVGDARPRPRGVTRHTASDLPASSGKCFHNGNPIFLGYILRLQDGPREADPQSPVQDVILESVLWTQIRSMLYEAPETNIRDRPTKAARFRDLRYVILHNCLNRTLRDFPLLFPQYRQLYLEQWRKIDCVMDGVYRQLSGVAVPVDVIVGELSEYLGDDAIVSREADRSTWAPQYAKWESEYAGLITQLTTLFRTKNYSVKVSPVTHTDIRVGRLMVSDMMVHKLYLDIYYEHFFPERSGAVPPRRHQKNYMSSASPSLSPSLSRVSSPPPP